MKLVIEGVMDGNLPWTLVFLGIIIAIALELCSLPVMPVAIGLYLPVQTASAVMIGGVVRWLVEHWPKVTKKERAGMVNSVLLFSSGIIAGEGLIGILLAVLAIIPIGTTNLLNMMNISNSLNLGKIGSLVFCLIQISFMLYFAKLGKNSNLNEDE